MATSLPKTNGHSSTPTLIVRLLEQRLDELLAELHPLSPDLVEKLELTLEALKEQWPIRGEYDGLDRPGVIRKYLLEGWTACGFAGDTGRCSGAGEPLRCQIDLGWRKERSRARPANECGR